MTEEFLENNGIESDVIKSIAIAHLSRLLEENFQRYFLPEVETTKFDWIPNPLLSQRHDIDHLSLMAQEELAELYTDSDYD